MMQMAKKNYYDTSRYTYLVGYNEDKEDEDKVEQARSQYMNTKREEIPSPTTPKRDGKYLEPVKTERKEIKYEKDTPRYKFNPSSGTLGTYRDDVKKKYEPIKTIKPTSKGWDGSKESWKDKTKNVPFKPFREGFDRAFDPFTDLVAGTNKETKAKREEEFAKLKESNPVQSTAGNIAGEFAKYGAGYAMLGPLASKAPGLAAIKNPIAKTLATEGAKDLAVGSTMRSIEGLADKQSPTEIGKNIIKDMPRYLAFNALLLGGGKAASVAKKAYDKNAAFKGINNIIKNTDINPKVPEPIRTISEQPKFKPSSIEDIRKAVMEANTPKPTDLNNVTDVLKETSTANIPKVETPAKSNLKGYMTEDADFNKVIYKIMSRDLAFFSNNPSKKEISRALDMYKSTRDGYISEMMTTLKKQMGKGTETSLIPTPDGMKRVTVSENPKWYRDFYKANGRKPNNQEIKELAEQFLKNGYDDMNAQIPKNDFFNELDDTVKAYEHLKNFDTGNQLKSNVQLKEHLRDVIVPAEKYKHKTPFDDENIIRERYKASQSEQTIKINTPEREQLRTNVLQELKNSGSFNGVDESGKSIYNGDIERNRQAFIVIGNPAAGKSTVFVNPLSKQYKARIIDSDMAKELLPEFNGGSGAGTVHEESARIVEKGLLKSSISNGENMVVAKVGKSVDSLKALIEELKTQGYDVHLKLNTLPAEKAAERAVKRYYTDDRFVDPDYVLNVVGNKPDEVYEQLKRSVDSYEKYSNDVEFKTPPRFIEYADTKQLERGRLNGFSDGLGRNQRQVPIGSYKRIERGTGTTGQIGSTNIGKVMSNDMAFFNGNDKVSKMLRGEIPESETELVKAYEGLKANKAQGMNIDLQLFTELEKKIDTLKRIKLGEEMKPQTNWFKEAYQKFVDNTHSLKDIDDVAKKVGADANIQMLAMNEKDSGKIISAMIENGVSDLNGNTVTRPIKEIFNQVDVKDKAAFTDYLLHKHNIDRMKQKKPVFGEVDGVLIDGPRSMQKVREYESMYPHFKTVSEEWNSAYDSFMRNWLVDGGLLSEAQYNAMKEMYPNYVPTYRDMSDKVKGQPKIFRPRGYVNQKAGIKGAVGSNRTVIDPIESQLQLMDKYIKATKRNQVGQELLRLVEEVPEMKAFADIIGRPKEIVNDLDEVENVVYNITKNIEWKKNEPNVVTVMRDGEPIYIAIKDKRVLDALLATSEKGGTLDSIGKTVNKYVTRPFKNLTTSNNPLFGGVNFMRDTQTRYIQGDNLNPVNEMMNTIKAVQDMAKNDEIFKKYKAVGGGANFLADDERAFKRLAKEIYNHGKSIKDLAKYPVEMVNKFNESVEILNRYPAFKSTYLDEIAKGTNERMALEKALSASDEITTNFNRGGSVTKAIDNFYPYTNAAVQGIDKSARTFKDKPLQTSFKVALATAIPSIGAYLMQKDDPDYQQLNNRTKDAYIPIGTNPDDEFGNNKFFKLPMAQTYNTIGSLANRTARAIGGEENAFKGFGQTVLGNLSPVDLSAGGIFSPIQDIQKNKDFAGRTIVPMSMQERSPYLQYDDKTSEIGKTVSKGLRGVGVENEYTSPKAIDHMIDSWTGVIGDFALPLTTNDGKTAGEKAIGPITRRFVADPIYSNQGVQDFYDSYNELKRGNADSSFMSNSADKGLPTVSKAKETEAFNISKAMSEISSEINQVQKSNLPAEQKETQIRALNIKKAMMAMEFNKANNVKNMDYSVPYEVNPYQADIDKLSTLGIDNVKPKVYNNSTYKVNDKEVNLTAEDKVKYTKMAGEMYVEKTAKIFKSNLSDEQKAKKIAEINKQIDKKIKEMMRRN